MFKLLVLIGLLALVNGQGDLDSVIQQIFGPSGTTGNGSKPGNSPSPGGTVTDLSGTGTNAGGTGTLTGATGTIMGGTGTNTGGIGTNSGGSMPLPSTIVPPVVKPNTEKGPPEPCTTDTSLVGECVRYYQCNDNNTFNEDGTGLIDIRVRDGPCASYLDTCCLPANTRPSTDPIVPTPKPGTVRMGCGWRNPIGVGFHTKGDVDGEAKFGEFPWMVAILKVEPVNENQPDGQKLNVYVGGGSLIHPNVVLTAAHYVSTLKQLKVRVGEWDTQTKNEIYPHQDRDVTEVAIHKDYNKGNLFYDVALLFLSAPVEAAPHIGTACLPPAGARAIPGALCYASGWGKDSFGKEGRYQVILKRVEVPVVERNTCQEQLRRTRLGARFQLHGTFMCAGGERGKDTCKGDGGSPLVCPIEYEQDRYVQNGIVAWGIGCGQDGTPGVYADVSVVRGWIDDKVAGRGFDPATYTYN